MKLHYEQDWNFTHRWWVTWNNHSLHRSPLIIKNHMQLMHDINEWFETTHIHHIAEQDMMGKAGYGFKTRDEAMHFFLRWQDASVGVLE